MSKFSEAVVRVTDTHRVNKIRQDEAARFAAQFAPAKAKAAANAKAFSAKRTFALA